MCRKCQLIMERNFKNVDFEEFIKDNADQYRMYPSGKVWKNISNALHSNRRWFGLGFVFLLLSSGLVTVFIVNTKKTNLKESGISSPITAVSAQNITRQSIPPIPITSNHRNSSKNTISISPKQVVLRPNDPAIIYPAVTSASQENKINALPAKENNLIMERSILKQQAITSQFSDERNFITDRMNIPEIPSNQTKSKEAEHLVSPVSLESALIYQKTKKTKKIFFQVYFTPTISYRKLTENKSFLQTTPTSIPFNYASLYNINNAVTHKPDMGLELGFTGKYRFSKAINVKAGLQFNISRYEIKAFNYPVEIATIALNNGYRVESVNTISSYRNFNGGKPDWLKNFYFQVSIPLGADVKLAGDDKIQFGVGSSIQPTYILGDRAYLISTDYKNYAEVPELIRRWNVNANLETYVAYSTGKLNWQVGPQVRYQLLSSFAKKYPVKENLFDFGLKVGVGLNK